MFIEDSPFLSDEFLDELAKEINQQFGGPIEEQNGEPTNSDID
ncbi:hypothetical protein JOC77_001626 [Peribacillus deserti]|uniref:Bacitracin ABC transporter ATP-binding protein n=1 Tax=Peribacillus deserti TaxID=673318 RepID=A0ABS2QGB8_9BACI|nr:hypothetical protein [Peribacillus deserti]MBM7692199.1 hypothetical protein [Peribacillus deserti]